MDTDQSGFVFYSEGGMKIKWVDNTHALGIFSSVSAGIGYQLHPYIMFVNVIVARALLALQKISVLDVLCLLCNFNNLSCRLSAV